MPDVPSNSSNSRNGTTADFPESVGRYRIIRRLGEGGMGSVFLALDTILHRDVALKLPLTGTENDPEVRERFLREARSAATLDHPYICRVYDADEVDGRPYLAMAYIEGSTLADLVRAEGVPPRQVVAMVGKLAIALNEAHLKGVVHRDLKPRNVMIRTVGTKREPVIVDFGLARLETTEDVRVTRVGQLMGTPAYMAPEQLRGNPDEIGPACDIYALGVILYELLTGQLPFNGPYPVLMAQILTQPPLPPSTHRKGLDPLLDEICLKTMAKEVTDRYATMMDLANALSEYLRKKPLLSRLEDSGAPLSRPMEPDSIPTGADTLVGQFLGLEPIENRPLNLGIVLETPEVSISPRTVRSLTDLANSLDSSPPAKKTRPGPFPSIVLASGFLGLMLLAVVILSRMPNKSTTPDKQKVANLPNLKNDDNPLAEKGTSSHPEVVASIPPNSGVVESSPLPEMIEAFGFKPLFNGKDLSGWKKIPNQPGDWLVDGGNLIGRNGPGLLLTEREDFENFHLRVQTRINTVGKGGIFIRNESGSNLLIPGALPNGYNVKITLDTDPNAGSLYRTGSLDGLVSVGENLVLAETWFLLEVIAESNQLRTKINGKEVVNFTDTRKKFSKGSIALHCLDLDSKVEFRRIEIKEMPSESSSPTTLVTKPDNPRLDGEAFLAANKTRTGVKTLPSGVQYLVLKSGASSGKKPLRNDSVLVHYKGTRIDGTEFENSYNGGEPDEFAVDEVSVGWKEVLQRMVVGDKWQVCIPCSLAIGSTPRPQGKIEPNDVLIFELELVEIKNPKRVDSSAKSKTAKKDVAKKKGGAALRDVDDSVITSTIGMKFKLIPAGDFLMGAPQLELTSEGFERPQHTVRISQPFYLGVYEVTQEEYQEVMKENPSYFSATGRGKDKVAEIGNTSRFPVENVSWYDAIIFCRELSKREQLRPCYGPKGETDPSGTGYRLPTEAEWEYACRAGTTTPYFFGETASTNDLNFDCTKIDILAEKGQFLGRTASRGVYRPNAFGLYNMHGNVWEWCSDWYDGGYYGKSPLNDPQGGQPSIDKSFRGGSWDDSAGACRSAYRTRRAPFFRYHNVGFRVARSRP
jgi:formylglycine-generating enzyme required for sulfatase activity/serine/threonine protein kinase/FKBP-type peptidyl-prolyl cis-trans isomerase